jgi:hypothetical protein
MVLDSRPTFARRLTHQGHVHEFLVAPAETGWEVREQRDSTLIRRAVYTDWQRVERARSLFLLRAAGPEQDDGAVS